MGLVGGMPNTRKHDSRHAVTGHNSHEGHSLKKDDIHLFYETNAARKCEFQGGCVPPANRVQALRFLGVPRTGVTEATVSCFVDSGLTYSPSLRLEILINGAPKPQTPYQLLRGSGA
jgi:hypothetical protein